MKVITISSVTTASAAQTLTVSGTPTDGDQVTIGNKTYTFKTTLGTTEGNVRINGSAAAAILNLRAAINHTGADFGSNADYYCAAAHTQVYCSASNSTTLTVTALDPGTDANAYATTDPVDAGSKLSWGAATMAGGANTITLTGTWASYTPTQPARQVTVGEFPSGNASWSRGHRLTDAVMQCLRSAVSAGFYLTSLSKAAMALERTLTYAPKITTQPSAASCTTSTVATFTVVASSEITATYQWQYYKTSTSQWINCTGTIEDCAYTNDTTATLTCTPTTTGQNGISHRCQILNVNGLTTTDSVVLTIT